MDWHALDGVAYKFIDSVKQMDKNQMKNKQF